MNKGVFTKLFIPFYKKLNSGSFPFHNSSNQDESKTVVSTTRCHKWLWTSMFHDHVK